MVKISEHLFELRNMLLFFFAVLVSGTILMLGWINHRDFERSVINAELRELLIIAKSASHDIEHRIIGIKQEPQYIGRLIQQINDEESFNTFIMDGRHIILSAPVKRYIGKDILEVGKEALNTRELFQLDAFVAKLDSNSSGAAILAFPTKDEKPKKEIKLFAFARSQVQNGFYYVVVTERLSALTGPIHRNLRDILALVGLFFIICLTFGLIFYRSQKKKIQLETTSRALEIINRQLHCEIDDYRCIERSLKDHGKGSGGDKKVL